MSASPLGPAGAMGAEGGIARRAAKPISRGEGDATEQDKRAGHHFTIMYLLRMLRRLRAAEHARRGDGAQKKDKSRLGR